MIVIVSGSFDNSLKWKEIFNEVCLMLDSIQDLRILIQIVESGTLSGAARALRVSPAYVSKRLRLLEDGVQARLFQRTTRALTLTEEGRTLLGYARRLVAEAEEAQAVLAGANSLRGSLKVSAPASFGRRYVAPVVFAFLQAHPELEVYLSLTDRRENLVEHGIDVAIRIYEPENAGEIVRRLADNRRVLVAAPAYLAAHGSPRHPKELADHACLAFPGENEWRFEQHGEQLVVRPRGRFTATTGEGLTAAALAGLGIALKSTWDIHEELSDGRLVHVVPDWRVCRSLAIYAVYPSAPTTRPRVRLFTEALVTAWSPKPPWE